MKKVMQINNIIILKHDDKFLCKNGNIIYEEFNNKLDAENWRKDTHDFLHR